MFCETDFCVVDKYLIMRVLGITLNDNKQVQYGLTDVYGIGLSSAQTLCSRIKVDPTKKVSALSTEEENQIRAETDKLILEGDLKRSESQNIKRLKDIKAFRGVRHARHLPVKGQRTKTNSRTVRGNKRNTMSSGRRKAEKT